MKELIIIETSQPQKIKNSSIQEHISYKVYQEPSQKKSLFVHHN